MAKKQLDKGVESMVTMDVKDDLPATEAKRKAHQKPTKEQVQERRKRIPLNGGNRIPKIEMPGFHLVFSHPDNVTMRLEQGYEFVTHGELKDFGQQAFRTGDATSLDSNVTTDGGGGLILHLMRLPLEYWNDDRAQMEERIRNSTKAIHRKDGDDFKADVKSVKTEI